ncbi:hypothetical protein ACFV1L_30440 [Kitasatospora sp. NPDC059646]|uniref:hypothetical protein n=1 Tax=Kitasatospora sp. NPDC059646 TaxID=3346893 RepID=UPI003678CC4E
MRSRTIARSVLLAAGLTAASIGAAHAEGSAYGSYGTLSAGSAYTPITAPQGAAQWGSTASSQSSSGSAGTWDNEIHSGTASNYGQDLTGYGATGTNHDNQAANSQTAGGSQTQYSPSTSTPTYGG